MSFWKTLGNVGKFLGKTALNVGGGFIGVEGLGASVFSGGSSPAPMQQVQQYNGDVGGMNYGNGQPYGQQSYSTPGYGAAPNTASGMLKELPQLLAVMSGNRPVQVNATSSALPSWLLPLGIVGGLVLAFKAISGRKR
jgi:hypothetical protein